MQLNFPDYSFQIKTEKKKNYIFDRIRKKYVVLTPEEWVRQHLICYLIDLGYPMGLISVERSLPNSNKRYDILVYDRNGNPTLIVECKAPSVTIGPSTLDQLNDYLLKLPVNHMVLSNGLKHYMFSRAEDVIKKYEQIQPFATISH